MPAILDKMRESDRFFLEVEMSGLYPGDSLISIKRCCPLA
jgi:hypothetical protein